MPSIAMTANPTQNDLCKKKFIYWLTYLFILLSENAGSRYLSSLRLSLTPGLSAFLSSTLTSFQTSYLGPGPLKFPGLYLPALHNSQSSYV